MYYYGLFTIRIISICLYLFFGLTSIFLNQYIHIHIAMYVCTYMYVSRTLIFTSFAYSLFCSRDTPRAVNKQARTNETRKHGPDERLKPKLPHMAPGSERARGHVRGAAHTRRVYRISCYR